MREFSHIRRTNDWVRILTLITLIGTVIGFAWAISVYPLEWADNTKRLNRIEPIVLQSESDLSNMRTDLKVISAQYQDIHDDLMYLRRKANQ